MLREYFDAFLVAGLTMLLLITFVVRTFYIPSISMIPTLAPGDVLLVNELEYRLHPPRDGEVAVFVPPVDASDSDFIKRVIGVPGDAIRISDGVLYRNGIALSEPYENQPPRYDLEIREYGIYVDGEPLNPKDADIPPRSLWQAPNRVPKGFYLMLGDNRNYSDDSHVWGFAQFSGRFVAGPLASRAVQASFAGRAFMTMWPLARIHVLH